MHIKAFQQTDGQSKLYTGCSSVWGCFFNSSHLSLITEEKFTFTPLRFLTDRQTFQLEYKETYDNIHKLCEVNKNLIR